MLYRIINDLTGYEISKLHDHLRLEEDLGVYGDDAVYFMEKYSEIFGVDINDFPFYEYFSPESDNVSLFLRKLIKKLKKNKTLTIKDLKKGIEKKKLI